MKQIAIIAALQREVESLISSHCPKCEVLPGTSLQCFSSENLAIVCGGIGMSAANEAAETVVRMRKPDLLISVGFAGALALGLRVGDIVEPEVVVDAVSGAKYPTLNRAGKGLLISAGRIADASYKLELRERYRGIAVDMEAAAVAKVAAQHAIGFSAVKAISDGANVTLPDVFRFINQKGDLRLGGFLAHLAVRPWLWAGIVQLARNSGYAARTLHDRLSSYVTNGEFLRMVDSTQKINPR